MPTGSFIIRSVDRHASSPNSASAKFFLEPGYRFGDRKGPVKLRLEYAQVYNTVYNIQDGAGLHLNEIDDTVLYRLALRPGYYDGYSFAVEIARALTAGSGNAASYTCTYNPTTFKLTIGSTISFKLRGVASEYKYMPCWREMGMYDETGLLPVDGGFATSYTCPSPVKLNLPLSWYVTIPELGSNLTISSMDKYSLFLPMTVGAGGVMEYNRTYMPQELTVAVPLLSILTVKWQTTVSGTTQALSLQNSDWELGFSYDE